MPDRVYVYRFRRPRIPWLASSPRREAGVLAVIAALLVGVVTYVIWHETHPQVQHAHAASISAPLGLQAVQSEGAVRLYWDHSLAQRKAQSGILLIVDGEDTIRRVVSAGEIHSGGLSYRPISGDVTFFLTAYGPGGFVMNQALRWIEPSYQHQPAAVKAPVTSTRATRQKPRVVQTIREEESDIAPPKKRSAPVQTAAALIASPMPAERVHEPVERPATKPIEEPRRPGRRAVAETMPAVESTAEADDRPRAWKKPFRWLGAKTSRILGRKPADQ